MCPLLRQLHNTQEALNALKKDCKQVNLKQSHLDALRVLEEKLKQSRELYEEASKLSHEAALSLTAMAVRIDPIGQKLMLKPVMELELTTRSVNGLLSEDISTVGKLLRFSEEDLLKIPNLGRKSVDEIREVLATRGLKLAPNWRSGG